MIQISPKIDDHKVLIVLIGLRLSLSKVDNVY